MPTRKEVSLGEMNSDIELEQLRTLLGRFLSIPPQGNYHAVEGLQDGLAVACVKAGVKPCFLTNRLSIPQLRRLARENGLLSIVTNFPNPIRKSTNVPKIFLDAFDRLDKPPPAVWIYPTRAMEANIERVRKGEINAGSLLGYPSCCVQYEETTRVGMVEKAYSYLVKANPEASLDDLVEILLEDPALPSEGFEEALHRVAQTLAKYPFVFHQACDVCLSEPSSPTKLLNDRHEELASKISVRLHDNILRYTKKPLSTRMETNNF